ncbi:uncharacterized protein LOC113770266 isoform X1 [Coffea eugenioides]|uniref:uncharacterized protein LOC113770266 isoform X1 n=1 Tax=Coffea eugenioides TaxID=49369 RepID=UPI000F60814D|nr:uncharacterized protein LOC113770266 isoform X1 [Coffea eugenioides]
MGGKLLQFYNLSQTCRIRCLPVKPISFRVQMYSQLSKQGQKENGSKKKPDHHRDGRPAERAASTAEEFRRVAEEKARQGTTSQTVEKEADAFQETMAGDTSFETVKESFKKPPGRGNIHKTGDESDPVEK